MVFFWKTIVQSLVEKSIQTQAHPSWHRILSKAAQALSSDYLAFLSTHTWLPGKEKIFNAFQLPFNEMHYILYGESPYPRAASANGFAFWDADVHELWAEENSKLSKKVNRATSLRNFMKMLLHANTEAAMPAKAGIQTLDEFFQNLLSHGFLLLNFNLSLSEMPKNKEAKYWFAFHETLLEEIVKKSTQEKKKLPELILFGKIASLVLKIPASQQYKTFIAEHPYNLSFITNPEVLKFFKPFQLLHHPH